MYILYTYMVNMAQASVAIIALITLISIRAEVSRVTAAKRATAKRLSLDSVAMRLAKAESMPGLNLAEQAGRRFGGSQASLASSTLTIATNPPPATSRDHAATGGTFDLQVYVST